MPTVLKDLRKAPWTLWTQVALTVVLLPVGIATASSKVHWRFLVFLAIFVPVISFFLLRGSRIVWWFLVLSGAFGFVASIIMGEPWYRFPVTMVGLGLLLAPPSRRYVFPPRVSAEDAASRDPVAHEDATRPPGWYFDPHDATRMRYWDASLGGWQSKTTRAPRKVRRQLATQPQRPRSDTWDPDDHDDATRPPGWYLDPADPSWMRYWDSELGGWQGKTTRAPRRLRRDSRAAGSD